VEKSLYQVESPEPVFAVSAAATFLAHREFPVARRRPRGERTVDLRPQVADLEVLDAHHLHLSLNHAEKDNLKVSEVLRAVFALTLAQSSDLRIVRVKVV
jgi:hypothetical protein